MALQQHEQVDWYDLPAYYDLVFEEDTEREAAFLEAVSALYGGARGRRGLEPACGSGRLMVAMARRGWRMCGFDANPHMLERARRKGERLGLDYRLADGRLERFRVSGRFDMAFCLVSTFKYLLTEADARSHLRSVAGALKPGGIYVLGFHLTEYAKRSYIRERWMGERPGLRVTSNLQIWPADRKRRLERVRSRLKVEQAGQVRRYETHWDFRTYDARQVRRLLRSVPDLRHLATYDFNYDLRRERRLDDRQLDTVLVLRRE